MTTTRLKVQGMSCGHCVSAVQKALASQKGVTEANVDLEAGAAEVSYDESEVGTEQLVAAIEGEGYKAQVA